MEGIVKSLILSQLLLEANDSLIGTNFYKQEFKRDLNNCMESLERFTRQYYDSLYENDPEMATNAVNKLEAITGKLTSSSFSDLIMIDAVIDKYNNNKDWFREHVSADFLKL